MDIVKILAEIADTKAQILKMENFLINLPNHADALSQVRVTIQYWNEYVEHLNYLNDKLLNIAPEIYKIINWEIAIEFPISQLIIDIFSTICLYPAVNSTN